MTNIIEIEFRQACKLLGVIPDNVGQWGIGESNVFFTDAGGKSVKYYDDVVLARHVPVSGGVQWMGGDAKSGCIATVVMFSTGARGVAHLECYSKPEGFAFGWEETAHLKPYKTTEEKWPK